MKRIGILVVMFLGFLSLGGAPVIKKSENKTIAVKPVAAKPEIKKPAVIKAEPGKPQLIPVTKPSAITPPNNTSKPHAAE